ncbi:M56 family metallopeptidase [Pseudanabaena sp. UWO310]|uniref:M56 family metallopeptidase n=1 Tax=Pseudanabaena sp. UWO310 TaxID=2480795 RepID=UPI001CC1E8F2|nr:M56 family metallopeptidase [Pseudanabaena sp. UWO310]
MPFFSVHSVMIFGSLFLAWGLRYGWGHSSDAHFSWQGRWQERWQKALVCFVLPPMLVVMTAIAVLCMGFEGQMIGLPTGRFSYGIALVFLIYCLGRSLQLAFNGWQSLQKLQNLVVELKKVNSIDEPLRLLNMPMLFAAQIGFWRSHLFVSQGLLDTLDREHLEAVLCHERAHAHYRDTFWFFWLGCLRQVMPWLPNTQTLWEELLLLRELRADRWAAQYADGLLLAESLLTMVSGNTMPTQTFSAAFGSTNTSDRLEERIDFLLAEPEPLPQFSWRSLFWIGFSLLPLAALPLHY